MSNFEDGGGGCCVTLDKYTCELKDFNGNIGPAAAGNVAGLALA